MIKTNKGKLRAKGSITELLADISVAVNGIYFNSLVVHFPEEQAREMMHEAVERALLTPEQLAERKVEKLGELLKTILDIEEPEEESAGEDE